MLLSEAAQSRIDNVASSNVWGDVTSQPRPTGDAGPGSMVSSVHQGPASAAKKPEKKVF